jgi:hypothetical protein
MSKFYLYSHINKETSLPFYIGIGTKEVKNTYRGIFSRAFRKSGRSQYWKNYTKKHQYEVSIICESDFYDDIKALEIEYIRRYGKKKYKLGTLVNLTDGGEGVTGFKHSEESKKKMSIAKKGTKLSEEIKQTMSEREKGKTLSKEHKEKIANSLKGQIRPQEVRDKISKKLSGRKMSDETKKKISEKMKQIKRNEL